MPKPNLFQISIKFFDGKDLFQWKDKDTITLKTNKCDETIEEELIIDDEDEEKVKLDKTVNDNKAKMILINVISDKNLRTIKRDSAIEIWESLTKKYGKIYLQSVIFVRINLFNAKPEDN